MTNTEDEASPPLSPTRKLMFTVVITALAAVTAFGLCEVLVRATTPSRPTPAMLKGRMLDYRPSLFSRHIFPRKELRATNGDENDPIEYYINAKGYRGRDFAVEKPRGAVRIMFYGGSATFDMNLPERKDWPHRVEAILKQNGYPHVEVINAGIPGHASWDSVGRLFSEGHHFSPDYVVSMNGWNDFRYFRSNEPLLREFQPLCAPSRNTDPRLNYRHRLDELMCTHSQFYLRLRAHYADWRLGITTFGAMPDRGPLSSEITANALRQYSLNQNMFVELAREIGAVPVLMMEPRLTMPGNTDSQKDRMEPYMHFPKLDHVGLVKGYEGIERAIRSIAVEKQVELLDLASQVNGRDECFSDPVHLTPRCSEEFAQITAAQLAIVLKKRTEATPAPEDARAR